MPVHDQDNIGPFEIFLRHQFRPMPTQVKTGSIPGESHEIVGRRSFHPWVESG